MSPEYAFPPAVLLGLWLNAAQIGSVSQTDAANALEAITEQVDVQIVNNSVGLESSWLDVGGREDLVSRLAQLAGDENSPSLVLVTHHVEEIPPNFTHALLLKSGQVSARGAVSEVVTSSLMSEAFGIALDVEYGDQRWHAQGKQPSRGRRAKG